MQQNFVLFDNRKLKGMFDVSGYLQAITTDGKECIKLKPLSNWRLSVKISEGTRIISADDMEQFSALVVGDEFVFTWAGITRVNSLATVSVRWCINDALLQGKLSYNNFQENCKVEKIHFPVVEFKSDDKGALIAPVGMGIHLNNARPNIAKRIESGREYAWSYLNGASMQFCAYIENGAGLYFDTRDSDSYVKSAAMVYGEEGTLVYLPTHPVPLDEKCPFEYEMPYESGICQFYGGWHSAASIYKEWAVEQKWYVQRKTIEHSKDIDDIGLWCWNRGRRETVVPPVEKLNELLDMTIGLDWYWWHAKPYDCGYPEYFPPREGDKFKEAINALNDKGVFTQVYVNGVLWDMDDELWQDGGELSTIIKEDGTAFNFLFNKYLQHRLAYMCGTAGIFQEKLLRVASQVKELGVKGLYLDVIAVHSNEPCYNPAHKHAPGGGCYQVAGHKRLLANIKSQYPDLSLSSESCGEVYMDTLDSGILLDPSKERLGYFGNCADDYGIIPLFKVVYPDSTRLFGNYALIDGIPPYDELWPESGRRTGERDWQSLYPDQFFIEMARNVVWGLQPTVANLKEEHFDNPKYKDEIEFMLHTARFYYQNRDFLLYGMLLEPGELDVEEVEVNFLVRMIFTADGEDESCSKLMPVLMHSVWRNRDGKKAVMLANYTSQPRKFEWSGNGYSISGEVDAHKYMKVELC